MTEHEIIQAISIKAELTLEAAGRAYRAMQEVMQQALEKKEKLSSSSADVLRIFAYESELSFA